MNLSQLLQNDSEEIITNAFRAMNRARLTHYEEAGSEPTKQRLKALYDLTTLAVEEKNLGPMLHHAETIAEERFTSGYDLSEVQTAFNVLEESIWHNIIQHLQPAEYAEAFGLIGTVLGAGKDMLARSYVSLASKTKAPSLNLQSLFAGAAGT